MAARTLLERFEDKYVPVPETGCWIWTDCLNTHGYGRICAEGRDKLAHRISWELHVGPIPDGLHVLHRCDVRSCVNYLHLFLGTNQDNVTDKVQKGRQAKGSANGNSRLTEERVIEIFHAEGTLRAVAAQYEVSQQQVSRIKRKERWGHIHG